MIHPTSKDRGRSVTYVPNHAHGDQTHPDCETGYITSYNEAAVFVMYDRYGPEHSTSQSTNRVNLFWKDD